MLLNFVLGAGALYLAYLDAEKLQSAVRAWPRTPDATVPTQYPWDRTPGENPGAPPPNTLGANTMFTIPAPDKWANETAVELGAPLTNAGYSFQPVCSVNMVPAIHGLSKLTAVVTVFRWKVVDPLGHESFYQALPLPACNGNIYGYTNGGQMSPFGTTLSENAAAFTQ